MRRTPFSGLADEAGAVHGSVAAAGVGRGAVGHIRVGGGGAEALGTQVVHARMSSLVYPASAGGLQNERGRYPQGALGFDEARGVAGHAASFWTVLCSHDSTARMESVCFVVGYPCI